MIIQEVRTINGKQVNYTYSDIGATLRCGRLRYTDAADPINIQKHYFEEITEPIEESENSNNN